MGVMCLKSFAVEVTLLLICLYIARVSKVAVRAGRFESLIYVRVGRAPSVRAEQSLTELFVMNTLCELLLRHSEDRRDRIVVEINS